MPGDPFSRVTLYTVLHCLKQGTKSEAYRHIRFFVCGIMTPALMSEGPGFRVTLVTSCECVVVIDNGAP